jgi:acylphosphatase
MATSSIKRLRIRGLVQGVSYRAGFDMQARASGLSGWVRNRADGSVEAMIAGDTAAVERIIAWARTGPPGARVDEVTVASADATEVDGNGFSILPTL